MLNLSQILDFYQLRMFFKGTNGRFFIVSQYERLL